MNLSIRQLRNSQGFTMAELIIVIAILAVLIVYLVRNFGVRADDAKIAMVSNILSKDVPAAFQAFILENNGCLDPSGNTTNISNILGANNTLGNSNNTYTQDAGRSARKFLLDNGVPAGTPWDNADNSDATNVNTSYSAGYTVWNASFVPAANNTGAYLLVTYPLNGAGNIARAQALLESKLENSSEIHSINNTVASGGIGRSDIPNAPAASNNSINVHYACS